MKIVIILVIGVLFFGSNRVMAQHAKDSTKQEEILTFSEQMPEFPGGMDAMYKYISKSVKYPEMARLNNIEGKVIVVFVVTKSGKIEQVEQVSKPIGYGIDEEAIRVIKAMPKWKPGKQKGKKVNVKYTLPLRFKLN